MNRCKLNYVVGMPVQTRVMEQETLDTMRVSRDAATPPPPEATTLVEVVECRRHRVTELELLFGYIPIRGADTTNAGKSGLAGVGAF